MTREAQYRMQMIYRDRVQRISDRGARVAGYGLGVSVLAVAAGIALGWQGLTAQRLCLTVLAGGAIWVGWVVVGLAWVRGQLRRAHREVVNEIRLSVEKEA